MTDLASRWLIRARRSLRTNIRLLIGLSGSAALGVALYYNVSAAALAATAAGTGTATVVVGFELLRQVETEKHRRDDFGLVVEALGRLEATECADIVGFSTRVLQARSRLELAYRSDAFDVIQAYAVSQASAIPFFRANARTVFAEARARIQHASTHPSATQR